MTASHTNTRSLLQDIRIDDPIGNNCESYSHLIAGAAGIWVRHKGTA